MASYYKMISLYNLVIKEMQEKAGVQFRSYKFNAVAQWICENQNVPESAAATFANAYAKGNVVFDATKKDCGFTRMMWQAFALLQRLRVHGQHDQRPLHIYLRVSSDASSVVPVKLLTAPFLLTKSYALPHGSRSPMTPFGYSEPTSFEKVLFIAMCLKVSSTCKKGMSVPASSSTRKVRRRNPFPAFRASYQHGSRIGSVVEAIVRAWDDFSVSLGFKDCEDLVGPYVILGADNVFTVIETREAGYAPKSQLRSVEDRPAPSTDVDLVSEEATMRPDDLDNSLRTLSGIFLKDLDSVVMTNELYAMPEDENWPLLQSFYRSATAPLPERFAELSKELVDLVRKHTGAAAPQTAQGVKRVEMPLVTPPRKRLRRAPTSEFGSPVAPETPPQPASLLRYDEEGEQEFTLQGGTVGVTGCDASTCACAQAIQAEKDIMEAVAQHVRIHCCRFQDFISAEQFSTNGEPIIGNVQLVLTDPPFNYRLDNNQNNSWYDKITPEDMEEMGTVLASLLRPGGHAVIYTSPTLFSDWVSILSDTVVEDDEQGNEEEEDVTQVKAFNVDAEPIVFVRHPGHYKTDPSKKTTMLHGICDYAVHLTRVGATLAESHEMVKYESANYVSSRHKAWTNVIDNMERHAPGELVRKKDGTLLRTEQKTTAALKELISRFSHPGDIVVDLFAGTFATASACLSLPQPRRFVGCDFDEEACEVGTKLCVLPALLRSIVNKHIQLDDETVGKAEYLTTHRRYRDVPPRDREWRPPAGLHAFQSLPSHILAFIATDYGSVQVESELKGQPVSRWKDDLLGYLQTVDPKVLRGVECSHLGLCVSKSLIRHPSAGLGVFALRKFRKSELVAYYYGALVYDSLRNRSQKSKIYGLSGCLGADVHNFTHKAVVLKGPAAKPGHQKWPSKAYIVPPLFCVAGFINGPEYQDGDEEVVKGRDEQTRRTANVKLKRKNLSPTAENLANHTILYVEAARDIAVGEELYMSYIRR